MLSASVAGRRVLLKRILAGCCILVTVVGCGAGSTRDATPTAVTAPAAPTTLPYSTVARATPPPTAWRVPGTTAVSDQGIEVFNLGSYIDEGQYVVTFLAIATSDPTTQLSTVASDSAVADSRGGRYTATHRQMVQREGVTVVASAYRPSFAGRGVLSLNATAVEVGRGPGPRVLQRGQWSLDLLEQLVDTLGPRALTSIGGRNPLILDGLTLRLVRDTLLVRIVIEPTNGPTEVIYGRIDAATGIVGLLSPQEFGRLYYTGRPPSPTPVTPDRRSPRTVETLVPVPTVPMP